MTKDEHKTRMKRLARKFCKRHNVYVEFDSSVAKLIEHAYVSAYLICLHEPKRKIAGRPAWHDLQKDPNDLPDNHRCVWTNVGAGYHDDDGWWDDFGRLQDVVAWCEPKFEE